jgi:hypothetical protein
LITNFKQGLNLNESQRSGPHKAQKHTRAKMQTSHLNWAEVIETRSTLQVRASPRVCQNLLGKSCVLPISKKAMQSKKRIHLHQFGIIHLLNPDLTYIRNPERNTIMYVPFHLLKNLHQESFSIFYFFFTLPPRGKQRCQPRSARAYMCVGR